MVPLYFLKEASSVSAQKRKVIGMLQDLVKAYSDNAKHDAFNRWLGFFKAERRKERNRAAVQVGGFLVGMIGCSAAVTCPDDCLDTHCSEPLLWVLGRCDRCCCCGCCCCCSHRFSEFAAACWAGDDSSCTPLK
jgi:hypothetical protein